MQVLAIRDLSKSYGSKQILDGVTLSVNAGDRIGLVGPNGVGKSTILKIITGDVERDGGDIVLSKGAEIGYLPQTFTGSGEKTIEQIIFDSQRELRVIEQRMAQLVELMSSTEGDELAEVLEEYGELSARFEARGGYDMDYRTEVVLEGLRIGHLAKDRTLNTLSGGQKTRVGLAALLISSPDLLLLDEPTNHLDFQTLGWLEQYLAEYRGGLLMSSHDRQFLNTTVNRIIEIDEYKHTVREYFGNYDQYVATKAKERRKWEDDYQRQQDEIKQLKLRIKEKAHRVGHNRPATDNDKSQHKFFGEQVQRAVSRNVRAAEKQLERIMEDPVPPPPQPMRFAPEFDPAALGTRTAMIAKGLSKSFGGEKPLFEELGFSIGAQSRMLILGPNGAGKTTLLSILAGQLEPDSGSIYIPPEVTVGFLEQEGEFEDPEATVLEEYRRGMTGYREEHVSKLLSYQLFRYEELNRQVGQLSPGQYRKLQLAKLMASKANLLIIDEPTNHISLDVLEELEQALEAFPGPVITVSHDRWFINRFKGTTWELQDGKLVTESPEEFTAVEEEKMLEQIRELSEYPIDNRAALPDPKKYH